MEASTSQIRETQALAKLVGESPALLKTIEQLPAIAASEATVLIIGETGTGKELVARALHYLCDSAVRGLGFWGSSPADPVSAHQPVLRRGASTVAPPLHGRR